MGLLPCDRGVQEWLAFDHGEDQGRKSVFVRGEPGDDLVDGPAIGSFAGRGPERKSASSRRGSGQMRRGGRSECGLELGRARKGPAARQPARRIDRLPRHRVTPGADGVEVFQSEAQRVHAPVARGAGRVGPVPFHPLAQRAAVGPSP